MIGTAVLTRPMSDGVKFLYFIGEHADGRRFLHPLPARFEDETPKYPDPHPVWTVRRDGNKLHGHPSINIHPPRAWHNAYNWTVDFVEHDFGQDGKDPDDRLAEINGIALSDLIPF